MSTEEAVSEGYRCLPVDLLKIDQCFVRDMLEDHGDMAIVESVVRLSQAFNRTVIAEGIETLEHTAVLTWLGCRRGQGLGIARPMPADELHAAGELLLAKMAELFRRLRPEIGSDY
ncbi:MULTISPECIES: EAL domain-containing protein [Thiorhodovibrio]|uniref:EAL domain-containing protein n=1 Tax=Thiorhodovibrio TaxID=61593 RepID=UPI002B25B3B8|nr:EAL domain-containing protein [Thiorhodovibrio litoralis]WPL10408.1 Bacteriophytochrome cph2 [Thiorhodovibrio litoralis]